MSQGVCAACQKEIEPGVAGPLCGDCQTKSGLRPAPPAARRLQPCGKCGHHIWIRAQVRERSSKIGGEMNDERPAPFAITFAQSEEFKSFWSGQKVPSLSPDLAQPFGILEAYVCRSCGFVEWYAREPERIPIGDAVGTQLIEIPTGGPLR